MGELVSDLRVLLGGKRNERNFSRICDRLSVEKEDEVVLGYVLEHMRGWRDEDRRMRLVEGWREFPRGRGGWELELVRELDATNQDMEEGGMRALCGSCRFGGLREWRLSWNRVGDEGMVELGGVEGWDVGGNGISGRGMEALACSENFGVLEVLDVGGNGIGDKGMEALACSENFGVLEVLDVGGNGIGDKGMEALACSENFGVLEVLDVGGNGIGDKGMMALAASRHYASLSYLDARENGIGVDGVRALMGSKNFPVLREVNLMWNKLSLEELEEMRRILSGSDVNMVLGGGIW